MAKQKPEVHRVEVEAGYLHKSLRTMGFLPGTLELIKNPLDYRAGLIEITTSDRDSITFFDDGTGMPVANRSACIKLGFSTAGSGQHGQFGSGLIRFGHAFGKSIDVRTVTAEDPKHVYSFSMPVEGYEVGVEVKVEREPVTAKSWAHNDTGAEITIPYRDPRQTKIKRGAVLAVMLADILPSPVAAKISVDGVELPERQLAPGTRTFMQNVNDPNLGGTLFLEFWRTGKGRRGNHVMTGHGQLPEVPLRELVKHLPEGEELHPIFTASGLYGAICWSELRRYASEQRATWLDELADEPRLILLVRALNSFAEAISNAVGIHFRTATDSDDGQAEVTRLVQVCNRHWATGSVTSGGGEDPTGKTGRTGRRSTPRESGPLKITTDRGQYALGETVKVTVSIKSDSGIKPDQLCWNFGKSGCETISQSPTEAVLEVKPGSLGDAFVVVEVPGTNIQVAANFDIVEERRLEFVVASLATTTNARVMLTLRNSDLLSGRRPDWRASEGEIEVEGQGYRAQFSAATTGAFTVMATDPERRDVRATCLVTVRRPTIDDRKIRIRQHSFSYQVYASGDNNPTFVTLEPGDADRNTAIFRLASPAYQAARKRDEAQEFMAGALAHAYQLFLRKIEYGDEPPTIAGPDVASMLENFSAEALEISLELKRLMGQNGF